MRTKQLLCSMLSVLLLESLGTGAIAASSAPQTIPVGIAVSLSGPLSSLGHQAQAGFEIAVEDINRTGGIFVKEYGKKIPLEIIVQDTESNPQKAISRMEWFYTSRKVIAYVGEGNMVNGQGVAEKNKVPGIIVGAPHQSAHERGLKYWFSPTGKAPDGARVIFDFVETIPPDKRPKTVAIFQEHTNYGVEQAEAYRKEALQRGYKVVVYERYTMMSRDLSPMIVAAKNAGAELVLSSPVAPDAMAMMKQMKELDYNPGMLAVIRGAEDLSWGKALGPMGDYVILNGWWHHRVKYPGVDKLNAAHQARFGRPADILTGSGYASIQILSGAIEKAGTLDTTKIRDAIAATDMMTVMGKVRFRANGTAMDPPPALVQWQGGEQKLVWPKEFGDTPFVYPIPPWKDR